MEPGGWARLNVEGKFSGKYCGDLILFLHFHVLDDNLISLTIRVREGGSRGAGWG